MTQETTHDDFPGRQDLAELAHAMVPFLACEAGSGAAGLHVQAYDRTRGWRVSLQGVIGGHLQLSGDGVLDEFSARELAALLLAGAMVLERQRREDIGNG